MYFNIQREMRKWVSIRQRYLVSPEHSRLAQANTVLITGIDKHYLDEARLAQLFSHLPGGVKRIWLNRNLKEMVQYHNARVKATGKLENAQVALIKQARNLKVKRDKAVAKGGKFPADLDPAKVNIDIVQKGTPSPSAKLLAELGGDHRHAIELLEADRLVPRSSRPKHKLPPKWFPIALPFTGTQVDTIDWAREQIVKAGIALEKARTQLQDDIDKPGTEGETYPPLNSAFIYFHQQIAAHMANQILLHDQPYRMAGHYTEVAPEDVVWSNLNLNPYERKLRLVASYAITLGLVILWTFPSKFLTIGLCQWRLNIPFTAGFIGGLSNLSGLCEQYDLGPFCGNNRILNGVVQGVLPPILLALLNLLLPIVLRGEC